jgi:predicted DNA-binding transcriptional regulator YafY
MAHPRGRRPEPAPKAVTAERAARLYRLLRLLGTGPKTRDQLTRRLRLDVRSFYRDLELLRAAGIAVWLTEGQYTLEDDLDDAVARLPFPDPHLTLGEAQQLAKGRSRVHQKLKAQIAKILRR